MRSVFGLIGEPDCAVPTGSIPKVSPTGQPPMRNLIIDTPGVFDDADVWRKFLTEMHRRRIEVTHIDDAMEVNLRIGA
jgi:hypothetical protein